MAISSQVSNVAPGHLVYGVVCRKLMMVQKIWLRFVIFKCF